MAETAYHPAAVLASWDETEKLSGIALRLDGAERHLPGQVVMIHVDGLGAAHFALANVADVAGEVELLVKRGSEISDAIVEAARRNEPLQVSRPLGPGFPVERALGRDVLLFAAGSGITPIRSVVQHLMANRQRYGRITLFYGQRQPEHFAYRGAQLGWERRGVRVVHCATDGGDDWRGLRGRVQEAARGCAFGGVAVDDAVAYLCGMKEMVAGVRAALAEAGLPVERTFLNY